MAIDTFHGDFMVKLTRKLCSNLTYHVFSIKTKRQLAQLDGENTFCQVGDMVL